MAAFSAASIERISACSSSNSSRPPSTHRTYSGRSDWALAPWRGTNAPKPISVSTWAPRAPIGRVPLKRKKRSRS
eukprot:7008903-Pyramimonas_sp.AAC.1